MGRGRAVAGAVRGGRSWGGGRRAVALFMPSNAESMFALKVEPPVAAMPWSGFAALATALKAAPDALAVLLWAAIGGAGGLIGLRLPRLTRWRRIRSFSVLSQNQCRQDQQERGQILGWTFSSDAGLILLENPKFSLPRQKMPGGRLCLGRS